MTTPKIGTIRRGGARLYVHPRTGEKAIGVTSVLNNLPKNFLQYWRAKVVAEFATDNAGTLVQMLLDSESARDSVLARQAAVDWLKNAPQRDTGKSAEDGTNVHDLTEKMAHGLPVGAVHPDYKPYVERYQRFLDRYQPEFLFLEETVWNVTHGYAGSFDALAIIEGETIILDTKTTRSGVHAEVALQLAAYKYAEHILTLPEPEPSLTEVAEPEPIEVELPKVSGAAVVHLRPDESALHPIYVGEDVFEMFLTLMKVREWDQNLSKKVLGNSIPF